MFLYKKLTDLEKKMRKSTKQSKSKKGRKMSVKQMMTNENSCYYDFARCSYQGFKEFSLHVITE